MLENMKLVDLPAIAVLGRCGLCTREKNVAKDMWAEANAHFQEVDALAMREADGSLVGLWGAMSDESMSFLPWSDGYARGLYLAGVEVYSDTIVPEGWTKWIMPARKYLVVEIQMGRYMEQFNETLTQTLPEMGLKLAGAACDYTEPSTGRDFLFFPVE